MANQPPGKPPAKGAGDIDVDGPTQPQPAVKASTPRRTVTFPPTGWDRADVVSSAKRPAAPIAPTVPYGEVTGGKLRELEARALLAERFAQAGFAMVPDAPFHHADVLVTLDGWDEARRVGYAYVSHADADVVTDFDTASEKALRQLALEGVAHILVLHDLDVADPAVLHRAFDAFVRGLPRP